MAIFTFFYIMQMHNTPHPYKNTPEIIHQYDVNF